MKISLQWGRCEALVIFLSCHAIFSHPWRSSLLSRALGKCPAFVGASNLCSAVLQYTYEKMSVEDLVQSVCTTMTRVSLKYDGMTRVRNLQSIIQASAQY